MIAAERIARRQVSGMWADAFYEVRVPEDLGRMIDTFQVVSGRAVSTALVRGRGYINYGDDWRVDYTASLAPKVLRQYPELSDALAGYEGKKVQVRGWIKRYNGPMVEITHPEHIELAGYVAEDDKSDEDTDDEEKVFEEIETVIAPGP